MATDYQINIYQIDRPHLLLACFSLDLPFPDIQAGGIIHAQDISGLDVFSPLLEIVYIQSSVTRLMGKESRQHLLLFTRAYRGQALEAGFVALPNLTRIGITL